MEGTGEFGSKEERDRVLKMIREFQEEPFELAKYVLSKTFALEQLVKSNSIKDSKLSQGSDKEK